MQRRAVFAHRNERLVNLGLGRGRQFDLRLFRSFLQTLKRHLVFLQVNTVLVFELRREVVDDAHIKVFTAKERVTVGGFHFEQAVINFKDGYIECTTTKVIDRNRLCFFFVEPVS